MIKFTANFPCPICNGYESMPRGEKRRCAGFLSDDRLFAHCTREEYSGGLPSSKASPPTFAHFLNGPCKCGQTHAGVIETPHVKHKPRAAIVAEYDYNDKDGELLFQVIRKSDKSFLQRRPDGNGNWVWGLSAGHYVRQKNGDWKRAPKDFAGETTYFPEVRRVPYRLPELLAADPAADTYICEGEKDSNRLVANGLVATTNSGGSGKWLDEFSQYFKGRNIRILPDNDDKGKTHAEKVASNLNGIAKSVKIIEFTNLPAKGDVSDFLDAGNTIDQLREQANAAPEWEATEATLKKQTEPITLPKGLEVKCVPDGNKGHVHLTFLFGEDVFVERINLSQTKDREKCLDALCEKFTVLQEDTPRRLVDAHLAQLAADNITRISQSKQDSDLKSDDSNVLHEPEPWPEPVDGNELLHDLSEAIKRYLILPKDAEVALSLWVVFTYVIDAGYISPRLTIISPEKRCGKTLLLMVLARLTLRALPATSITAAVLFRIIEKYSPTMMIDEADTFFDNKDELRGVINSGHTRSTAFVFRCVGDDHSPEKFSTWAAMAVASIGKLTDTQMDRSIIISMRRRTSGETVKRFRQDHTPDLDLLAQKIARWTMDNFQKIVDADPKLPSALNDRATDNWRPLFAIADVAGGEWLSKAEDIALQLSDETESDDGETIGIQLLADIRSVFRDSKVKEIHTQKLLESLYKLEGKPWQDFSHGKALSSGKLSNLLKPFKIKPKQIKIDTVNRNGYRLSDFQDSFSRYVPPESPTESTNLEPKELERKSDSTRNEEVESGNFHKTLPDKQVEEVGLIHCQKKPEIRKILDEILSAATDEIDGLCAPETLEKHRNQYPQLADAEQLGEARLNAACEAFETDPTDSNRANVNAAVRLWVLAMGALCTGGN